MKWKGDDLTSPFLEVSDQESYKSQHELAGSSRQWQGNRHEAFLWHPYITVL